MKKIQSVLWIALVAFCVSLSSGVAHAADIANLTITHASGILAGANNALIYLDEGALNITTKNYTWTSKHDGGTEDSCGSTVYTGRVGRNRRGYSITLTDNRTNTCGGTTQGPWVVAFELHKSGKTKGLLDGFGEPFPY